jgi:putative phage-type endonuclease
MDPNATTIEQRTPDWYRQRLGKVTASKVGDVTAKTKNGAAAARANYLTQLVVERLTGSSVDQYVNAAMEWGTNTEPYARLAYEKAMKTIVTEVGFIDHPEIPMSGASPDGLVYEDGLIEIKCPSTATHLGTLLGEGLDPKHFKQMQWQMACTGRAWCDYVSYDPRLPSELHLFIERVSRDDEAIASLEAEVRQFLAEVDAKLSALAVVAGLPADHDWAAAFRQ